MTRETHFSVLAFIAILLVIMGIIIISMNSKVAPVRPVYEHELPILENRYEIDVIIPKPE